MWCNLLTIFQYPHHTWQSWADRWKKYVSQRARPTLPEDDDEDEEEEEDDIEPAPVAPTRRAPTTTRPVPRAAQTTVSPPPKSRPKSHSERLNQAPVVSPVPSARSQDSPASIRANPFLLKSTGGNVFSNDTVRSGLTSHPQSPHTIPRPVLPLAPLHGPADVGEVRIN